MTRGPQRTVKRSDVLDQMTPGVVYTAGGIAGQFSASKDTVYHRLRELAEIEEIATKQTGGRARVWWIPLGQSLETDFIEEMEFRSDKDPDILEALVEYGERGEPVTSGELAAKLGEPQDSIYARLDKLREEELVKSGRVGGNSVVWWLFTASMHVQT